MGIEFSPAQLSASRASALAPGMAAKQTVTGNQNPQVQGMAELQSKLDELALTRPANLDAVRPAVTDVQYPPDELLNGIAHLLAIHLTQ